MTRVLPALSALLIAMLAWTPSPSAQSGTEVLDLAAYLAPNRLTRDTNGDSIADMVAARIVVPASASVEESVGAANIAARLGFETSALTLPLVMRDSEVAQPARIDAPILLGRSNSFIRALVTKGDLSLDNLSAGQGLIALVRSPLGGAAGLVVAGADDKGTLAAATELAARLPRAWNMTGVTLGGIGDQLRQYLGRQGVRSASIAITSIVVDSDRRGIRSVRAVATVGAGQGAAAVAALQSLDAAHRRGLEPQTLNFAEVASLVVDVVTAGKPAAQAAVARSGLNARTLTPPIDPNELATDSPGDRGRPADGAPTARGKAFDLTNPYSIDGWFGDGYVDLIPDRTETSVIIGGADDAFGSAHIAARLGLETTGISFPIAKPADEVREPSREQNPILVGRNNRLVQDLVKIGRARVDDLRPGEGVVQVVPNAFGSVPATVVAGADAAGTEAASQFLARRIPYVWDTRRGAPSLADLRTEMARFLGGKSAAGQAAQAVRELDQIVAELKAQEKTVTSFDVKLSLEAAEPALDAYLSKQLSSALGTAKVTVTSQAITAPTPVIDETLEIPWEVDDFWTRLRADVLPNVKSAAKVSVEARLSESPEYRKAIAEQARAELARAGAVNPDVKILSAYKQGFLWLTEQVIPALKGKNVRSVHIKVAEEKLDLSKKYKFYEVPSRWVHELYPVDDVMLREIGLPKSQFSIELVDSPKDTYVVEAKDAAGKTVLSAAFSPKFVEREYLDKFPGWTRVRVTTGWLTAAVDGQTVVDARIQTDPERFWDHYQSKVLPRIYDNVMKVTDNRPLPDKQPFHRDLDVEVWMSEPDFRIGVDEELVSSLESLHEDLYFVTLDFFDALGRTTTRRRLAAPGKIYPIIHPERRGKPGTVHVLYAGNAATRPQLEVKYAEKSIDKPETIRRDLGKIDTTAPQVQRAVVRADSVSEIELSVDAKDDKEAARAADAIDALGRLHAAGLYRPSLSVEHVGRVALSIAQKDTRTRRVVSSTGQWAPSNIRTATAKPASPLVTWDHVISPDESEEIVGKMAAFPEVRAYKAGQSYRGREISVMEMTLPAAGELVSLAKLTALKPTIFITGRQHANEVSSTSHVLKLAELILTDPSYHDILKKVNVILHPVENPDGAQMAFDLQKLTPTHMLHAGRYSALGMDVASQVGQPDPLLPEALVRMRLWQEWLPDIYLNPHGYPSHEWVQQFAGYVPPGFRTYWTTRGWYTTMSALRDPREPEHLESVHALREAVVREINSNADVRDMNLRSQERYRRWAFGFAPYVYSQEIYKDTAIYFTDTETGEVRGPRRAGASRFGGGDGGGGGGRLSMNQWPQVTFVSGGTESPDETAQNPWLNLVTKPGLSFVMAHVKFLRDGRYSVERIEEDGQRDGTSITLLRVRPVRPGAPAENTTTSGHQQ